MLYFFSRIHIYVPSSFFNIYILNSAQAKFQQFHILITSNTPRTTRHSSSATPALGRLAVFNRKGGVTGASSLADHSAFIYKRHSCRLLTWFVVFPEAFLAFAAQISGAVQEAVDLMAVLADEYAALFFSGGSADGTLLFCSVGAQLKYQDSFCPGFVFQIIPDADT